MCGVASRRKAEELVKNGSVKVNGKKVNDYIKIDMEDAVEVNGKIVKPRTLVYYMLNKPSGYITTKKDPQKRKTVFDLLRVEDNVFPVGRLDRDTEGLLILTNDGELSQILLHPRYEVKRVYEALVEGTLNEKKVKMLKDGIDLPYGYMAKMEAEIVGEKSGLSSVRISIHEGRKREIRRVFKYLGHPVLFLKRVSFGPINLDPKIKSGKYRALTREEIDILKEFVDKIKEMRPSKGSHP